MFSPFYQFYPQPNAPDSLATLAHGALPARVVDRRLPTIACICQRRYRQPRPRVCWRTWAQFIASTLNLAIGGMSAVVTLISFVAFFWRSPDAHHSGFFLSGCQSISCGRSLDPLRYRAYRLIGARWSVLKTLTTTYEAAFRFNLFRFRENGGRGHSTTVRPTTPYLRGTFRQHRCVTGGASCASKAAHVVDPGYGQARHFPLIVGRRASSRQILLGVPYADGRGLPGPVQIR